VLFLIRAFLSIVAVLAFSILASAQPPNDNFANRIPVEPGVPFDGSAADATFELLDPFPAYIPDAYGSVWWTWTPEATGFASIIDTKNFAVIGFDALAVYQGDDLETLRDPSWIYLSCLFEEPFGVKAFLGFPTTARAPVSIGMAGRARQTLTHSLLLTFSETPIIIEAPASQTNNAGGAVAFHFTSPSFRFGHTQWQFNSRDIPNATNAVLFLSDIRPSDAGEYRVTIEATNSAGVLKRTVSPVAKLTVIGDITLPTLSLLHAAAPSSDLILNILGATNEWYSVEGTSDFATWVPVKVPYWGINVTTAGANLISQPANFQILRVQHKGNLTQLCVQHLRQIHFAKELFRFAYHGHPGQSINPDDLKEFLGELPRCPNDGAYTFCALDTPPVCSLLTWGHTAYAGIP
jgi:hypothetical protein